MNLYSFISFITSTLIFFWGAFVFSKDTRDASIRLFLILSVITAYETISEYLYISAGSMPEASFWLKFHLLGWPIAYLVQIHFFVVYGKLEIKNAKVLFYTLYIITVSSIVYLSFFDVFTKLAQTENGWIRVPERGNSLQDGLFAVLLTSITLALTIAGIKYRLNAKGKLEKQKANFLLAGMLIPTWIPFLKNGLLPGLAKISILFPDSPFIFVGWIFLAIAILYFKMFDITPRTASEKILETMNEALILANIEGKIVWANKRFYELFELDINVVNQNKFDSLNEINNEAINIIGTRFQHEELKNLVVPINTFKGNQIYVGLSTTFLKNDFNETIGVIAIMNDLNELILAQQELKKQQKEMIQMAHQAGMSEVTTSVIHNIGNILNSVNVSAEYFTMLLSNSKLPGLLKANEILAGKKDSLAEFFTNDPKGKLLPDYYQSLGEALSEEHEKLKNENRNLYNKIKLIKDTIDIQQDYSKVRNLNEPINIYELIDEVLSIMEESFSKNRIILKKEYPLKKELIVTAPASKLINVFLNILKNAYESVKMTNKADREITIKLEEPNSKKITISISDNGIGIPTKNMSNIFKFGFTTKDTGHGYGLHFCANVLKEMNGTILANSKGEGKGAEFIVTIPIK